MAQYFEFIGNHPYLFTAFFGVLLAWIMLELRRGGSAIDLQEAVRLLNRENALVLDLRKTNEYQNGHIAGARNIPVATFKEKEHTLDNLKNRPIIVACQSGANSRAISEKLRSKGFQAYRLAGGMYEWQAQSMPLSKKQK